MFTSTAKAIRATVALIEIIHTIEFDLNNRNHNKLRNPLQRIQIKRGLPPIPA